MTFSKEHLEINNYNIERMLLKLNRKIIFFIIIACLVLLFGLLFFEQDDLPLPTVLTDENLLESTKSTWGFIGKDMSQKDFSKVSLKTMSNITFDNTTKWPSHEKLPDGFTADFWLEKCKSPGLNIKKIHQKGITGASVSVAIFDKPIFPGHNEIKDRIIYNEISLNSNKKLHFHGISCASIIAGKSCGIAPEAKLYYFAVPNTGRNFYYYCLAMDELLKLNKTLPEKEKIKVISISDGILKNNKYYDKWQKALQEAEKTGIIVIYSNNADIDFDWGGFPPYKDCDNPLNCKLANFLENEEKINNLIIPGNFKTTANNISDNGYTYRGEGGFSRSIAYLSGLCVLALDVNPNLSYNEIVGLIKKTSSLTSNENRVINPFNFIKSIQNDLNQ